MENRNDQSELENIQELLVDSRKGYMNAAERVDNLHVKGLLTSIAEDRSSLEGAVKTERHQQDPGAETSEQGTIKGDLHRAWMDLRDALSKSDNANVLSECERGETYLLSRYDTVLEKDDLDPGTRALATEQRAKVQGNLERIKQLRGTFEKIETK